MNNQHNILNDIRQGERDARAQAKAKRRGAALARSGGSRKGGFPRSAGRAAVAKMKTNGRGIAINGHENSKSFGRRINYVDDKEKGGHIIFQNGDIHSMLACARMRPDIQDPVGHISISMPPQSGRLTDEDWEAILETTRKALGLDDSFSMLFGTHEDTDHHHGHLIYSRVSATGKVLDQANIGLKCAAVERIIEEKHQLKLVHPSEFKNQDSMLTKNEIEKGIRTHQKPARLQIKDALKVAIQGRPTIRQFVERLQASGVGVRANVSETTGKMSGFSFSFDCIEFKASDIGRQFGWQKLQQEINYDHEIADREFIKQLNGSTGTAVHDLTTAAAIISGLNNAVAAVSPATVNETADCRDDPATTGRAVQIPNPIPAGASGNRFEDTAATVPRTDVRTPQKPASTPAHTRPVLTAPPGFKRMEMLSPNLRDWAGTLHNRIGRFRRDALQARALIDSRNRMSALSNADGTGYAIPEPKDLSDSQIETLLLKQPAGEPIQIEGNPDFCNRVEELAIKAGLKVVHEHQVSYAEKRAAESRLAARAREELAQKDSDMPVYSPK